MCGSVRICFIVNKGLSAVREDSSGNFTPRCHGWQHLSKM